MLLHRFIQTLTEALAYQVPHTLSVVQEYIREGPVVSLQMNRLSWRNKRLKFKTSGNLPIILEESIEYTSNE